MGRSIALLAVGICAGLLAGSVLFTGPAERGERARETEGGGETAAGPVSPAPPPPAEQVPADPTRPVRSIVFDGEAIQPAPVEELRAALAEARAASDWNAYYRALLQLGVSGTPEAEALLVEIMGDGTLRLHGTWTGKQFYSWLKDSDVPGIGEAARRRAEIEVRENVGSRWEGIGFLSLVALHADAAELDWLETLGVDKNRAMEVDRALAQGARNPLAAERLLRRWTDELTPDTSLLRESARANT